jgi:hypothetical protein
VSSQKEYLSVSLQFRWIYPVGEFTVGDQAAWANA